MNSVNILEAKNSLSRLVDAVARGLERGVVIARNGRPAAELVPVGAVVAGQRIGVAKSRFTVPNSIDASNEEAACLFNGG